MPGSACQPSILAPPFGLARFLELDLAHADSDPRPGLLALSNAIATGQAVLGFGAPLLARLGVELAGLRPFPALAGPGCSVPSTQLSLYCALYAVDRGELVHASRRVLEAVGPAFQLHQTIDGFTYGEGRDLSGYLDGTENPKGEAAAAAALVRGRGTGLDGGSFVAVQRFVHDLDALFARAEPERDAIIGRSLRDNRELADAPASAHVKRTAQESFEPPAFMLRRSLPYVSGTESGLYFVAYGESLDRFERVLERMLGKHDGVVDGLFRFTRPVSGGYYFCPPLARGRLDLSALGI